MKKVSLEASAMAEHNELREMGILWEDSQTYEEDIKVSSMLTHFQCLPFLFNSSRMDA